MSAATLWQLFDETPRPPPLPPAPYPNHHPFAVRIDDPPPAVVPVESGPLSTYWSHEVPIPGQGENAPPPWWPYSPQQDSPCPSPPALSCPLLPASSCPSPPASSRPSPPPSSCPSPPALPRPLPPASPLPQTEQLSHKPLKTYLLRTRRRSVRTTGSSPPPVLASPAPAPSPARRKKDEKRCGRSFYCSLKYTLYSLYSGVSPVKQGNV